MVQFCKKVVSSNGFNIFILAMIILSGILVGMEAYPQFDDSTTAGRFLQIVQNIILWIFVVEIAMKIISHGSKPWEYFLQPWNLFDFIIVAICFMPLDAKFATVFRLARVLRTLRMVTILPRLQVLVGALLRSIPSLGYIGILLGLHFYMYSVVGTFLFRTNDPIHFPNLHGSTLTLFQVLTLEGWNEILETEFHGSDATYDDYQKNVTKDVRVSTPQPLIAAVYFVSFIMLGTMIMLNLFTGVIITSMEEAQNESDEDKRRKHLTQHGFLTLHDELAMLGNQLQDITGQIQALKEKIADVQLSVPKSSIADAMGSAAAESETVSTAGQV